MVIRDRFTLFFFDMEETFSIIPLFEPFSVVGNNSSSTDDGSGGGGGAEVSFKGSSSLSFEGITRFISRLSGCFSVFESHSTFRVDFFDGGSDISIKLSLVFMVFSFPDPESVHLALSNNPVIVR